MKKNKYMIFIFTFFSSIFFFSSGEDVSWIGILITSFIYGLVMSTIVYLIYRIFLIIQKIINNLNLLKRDN